MKIDVIIPTYHPQKRFLELVERLEDQTEPVNRIIIVNTEKEGFAELMDCEAFCHTHPKAELFHIPKESFDHGGARNMAVRRSDADFFVCMTQDALPADRYLIENLMKTLLGRDGTAAAYARQLAEDDCSLIERYTRQFNYPEQEFYKSKADIGRMGIKTYFCSNVCAVYRREIFEELGGFASPTIFNEDMILAAKAVQAGYSIGYAAKAQVVHSHNYSGWEQLTRNFDLGVSHAQYPEVFEGVPPEGEGMKLVKQTAGYLLKKAPWFLPKLVWQSGMKWLGYRLGKRYERLPGQLVVFLSMQKGYWRKTEKGAEFSQNKHR